MDVRLSFRFTVMLYIFNVIIPSKALNDIVNQTEAEERCKASGGLASFEHFNPPPGTSHPQREPNKTVPDYLNQIINHLQIEEGESVWVSGRANYSVFISYHSCRKSFKRDVHVPNTFIEHNDLFLCWNNCASFTHMGIDDNRCYCLHESMFNSDFCSEGQYTNGTHVYLIDILHYAYQNDSFQCTLESRGIPRNTYSTDKCSGKMHGLCRKSFDDKRTLNCSNVNRQISFCILNESLSWIKHRDNCVFNGGMLFPYPNIETIHFMEAKTSYALGMFRTFSPVPKLAQSIAVPCLVVTRVGDKVWLEPEDCSAKRRYLCKNEQNVDNYSKEMTSRTNIVSTYKLSSYASESIRKSTISEESNITSTVFNEENITTVITESDPKSSAYRTTIIIVVVSISIAGVIIGALVRYFLVHKSRTRTKGATFGCPQAAYSTSPELGANKNSNADDYPNKGNETNTIVLRNYEYADVVDSNITTNNESLINETNIGSPEKEITSATDEYSTIVLNKNTIESTENVYDHTNSVLPTRSCRVRPGETSMVRTSCHIYDFTTLGVKDDTYNYTIKTGTTIVFSSDYDHIHSKDLKQGDFSGDYNYIKSKD